MKVVVGLSGGVDSAVSALIAALFAAASINVFAQAAAPAKADAAPIRLDSAALRQDARLVSLLRNAVENAAGEDGWSSLGPVGQQIGNQASFDSRNYGYRKLSDLIEASDLFEVRRDEQSVWVRDKPKARKAAQRPRKTAKPAPPATQ